MAERSDVTIGPGDLFVGQAPQRVRTLLGSCVAVTLWSPERRIGAMCHFLLWRRKGGAGMPPDGRYGEDALDWMVRELARRGVAPAECEGKVFGGGSMFPQRAVADIGRANGESVRKRLREQGVELVAEDLYGEGHRQVLFDLADGAVWSRRVPLAEKAA